ncbi:MAG: MFS transporter [Comamonas sp.]
MSHANEQPLLKGVLPSQRLATYLLLLLNCLSPLAAIVVAPSLPQMQAHFANVPNVEFLVPVSLTIPGLLVALLSPLVGWLADRVGRKRMLVGATFAYGLLGVLPLFLDSLYAIIASRVGLGCVEAVVVTVSTTLIGDYYSGALRQRYLALQTTFASTSAIVFFLIGGVLGEFGWRTPYLVYLVSILLAIVAARLLWEPARDRMAQDAEADGQGALVFRPALMGLIYLVTFIGAVAFMTLQINLAYLLGAVGENSPRVAGLVASACSVLIVLGTLSVHLLLHLRLRISHCLALAFGLIGLSFLLIATASSTGSVLAASLVNGLGCGLLLPSLAIWNMRELPWRLRGMGTGLWYGCYCLGMFFSPIIVVSVSKLSGSTASAVGWGAWVLLPVAAIALVVALISRRSAPAALPSGQHKAA